MTLAEIQQRIKIAPELDFGTIFSESIELFKKSIVHGFVMQIIVMIITIPLLLLIYFPFVMALVAQSEYGDLETSAFDSVLAGFSIFIMILFFLGVLLIGTITMALRAGFIRMLKDLDEGLDVNTKDLFRFFKGNYLGKMFVLLLATMIIASIALLLLVLPIFYVFVPISFFVVIFAFNPEKSAGDIITASFNLGTKKWLISFGLIVVSTILASMIGFLLCGIGTLFTAPFVYHPLYFIYKKSVGFENQVDVT